MFVTGGRYREICHCVYYRVYLLPVCVGGRGFFFGQSCRKFDIVSFFGSKYTPPQDIPSGTFHLGIFPQGMFPPTLFRFVARFASVRIEDSSRTRFASAAYFAQSQTTLFPCILFMGGMLRGGMFRGEYSGHLCYLGTQNTH